MPRRPPQTHRLEIPSAVGSLHQARLFVDAIAREAGFLDADREAICLAVTEAVSNAIRHGSPLGNNDVVELVVADYPARLVVTVHDNGAGFVPEGFALPDPLSFVDHGRGLYLIHTLMDEVIYDRSNGTTVRMTKRKPRNRTPS
jgi:serine/threonine-protein kinase RsbW